MTALTTPTTSAFERDFSQQSAPTATITTQVADDLAITSSHPTATDSSVPLATVMKGLNTALMILAVGACAAFVVAFIVLGSKLLLIGFCIAFLLIAFIGMPLILASIQDAIEQHS